MRMSAADDEGRARHPLLDTEAEGQPLCEGRLPGPEVTGQHEHITTGAQSTDVLREVAEGVGSRG